MKCSWHFLEISEPSYFTKDSPNVSFFVQAARELGYYGYDIKPFEKYLSIKSSKNYLHRLMLPEELGDMKFDKRLGRKIVKFLKQNDPKMIFIYGQNDPWTGSRCHLAEREKEYPCICAVRRKPPGTYQYITRSDEGSGDSADRGVD